MAYNFWLACTLANFRQRKLGISSRPSSICLAEASMGHIDVTLKIGDANESEIISPVIGGYVLIYALFDAIERNRGMCSRGIWKNISLRDYPG